MKIDPCPVDLFEAGDAIPDWLMVLEPSFPTAHLASATFAQRAAVISLPPWNLVIATDLAGRDKPVLEIDGHGLQMQAVMKPMIVARIVNDIGAPGARYVDVRPWPEFGAKMGHPTTPKAETTTAATTWERLKACWRILFNGAPVVRQDRTAQRNRDLRR